MDMEKLIEIFISPERKKMSINKYNSTTGQLEPLSQNRTWVGTEAEYQAAITAGTIGNDMFIYITDDKTEAYADQINYDNTTSGLIADDVQEAVDELNSTLNGIKNIIFPIGTVIYSTTCDTQAKVIAAYGGTTWIQHSGYMLRGAISGVTANDASKTGGTDDLIIPYHNHTFTGTSKNYTSGNESASHSHTFTGTSKNYTSGNESANHTHSGTTSSNGSHSHTVGNTVNNITNCVIQASSGICLKDNPLYNKTSSSDGAHTHTMTTGNQSASHTHTTTVKPEGSIGNNNANHTHTTTIKPEGSISYAGSSGNTTNANIPNYKSVYIWERTA